MVHLQATIDQVLRAARGHFPVDEPTLSRLLADHPTFESVAPLLKEPRNETVRSAVLYLSAAGSREEAGVLSLLLHHPDQGVVELAEYGLWRIWMQSGTVRGNRALSEGIAQLKRGELSAADQTLRRLIADEPGFAEAHFQHGLVLASLERVSEADRAYRQALKLNPGHFAAAAALGHACVEQHNLVGALYYYRRAIEIHPRLDGIAEVVRELERSVGRGYDA